MEQEKSKKQPSKSEPEPPEMDYRLGDLTPEYIEWFAQNHTIEEFYTQYIKRRNRIPQRLQFYFKKNT
jgi:hypothetical protein